MSLTGDGVIRRPVVRRVVREVTPTPVTEKPKPKPAAKPRAAKVKKEPKATETETGKAVVQMAQLYKIVLMRNNSGAFKDSRGKWVRFGLGNVSSKANVSMKSSDLIGFGPDGRFIAIEMKEPKWKWKGTDHEVAQKAFLDAVRLAGGVALFARSVEDAEQEFAQHYTRS